MSFLETPALARLGWLVGQFLSFEFIFLLFIFVETFKTFDPLPIDATLRFFALSVIWGIPILLRQGLYIPGLTIFGCLWLLLLWVILSYSWSVGQPHANADLMESVVLNSWAVIAGALIIAPNPERVRRLLGLTIVFGGTVALFGLYFEFVVGEEAFFRSYKSWTRIAGFALILSYLVFLHSKFFSIKQLVMLLVATAAMVYMVTAGGRGPFLAVVCACLIPLAVFGSSQPRRGVFLPKAQLIGIVAVIVAVVIVVGLLMSGEAIPTIGRLVRVIQTGTDAGLTVNRFWYFSSAIEFWFQQPLIGHGYGSYPVLLIGYYYLGAQPHNLVLSILSEQGLIGLILFLIFLWSSFRFVTYQKLCDHPIFLGFFMVSIYAILLTVTDHLLVNIREHLFFWSLLCMSIPSQYESSDEGKMAEDTDVDWDDGEDETVNAEEYER